MTIISWCSISSLLARISHSKFHSRFNRPARPIRNSPSSAEMKSSTEKPLSGEDQVAVPIQGFSDSAKDTEIVIENKKVGAG